MGKIIKFLIFFTNVSLILGTTVFNDVRQYGSSDKEGVNSFTTDSKQLSLKDFFNRKERDNGLPPGFGPRRQKSTQMSKSPGLQSYAVNDSPPKPRRRVHPLGYRGNGFSGPRRKNVGPFVPPNPSNKNIKDFDSLAKGSTKKGRTLRGPFNYDQGGALSAKLNNVADWEKNMTNRRLHYNNGRNGRFNHYSKHPPKICDACNSVPWVPLFKVPDSYRQQRTHVTELHAVPTQDFNFDFNGFASDNHNILLPPVPLVPPIEPVYASPGTISSSFGLPIGNIPTSHGLLAPLTTKFTRYGANSIDYSNSLKFFPTQSLLETPNAFPELSPVPIVPIHDSTQFYPFDTSIPDLVPPTRQAVDVSNVVLTISEDNHGKLNPDSVKIVHGKDLKSESTSTVDFQSSIKEHNFPKPDNKDLSKLEIVKSIPLIEFTSTVNYQLPSLIPPSANPAVQSQYVSPSPNPPIQHQFVSSPLNSPVQSHFISPSINPTSFILPSSNPPVGPSFDSQIQSLLIPPSPNPPIHSLLIPPSVGPPVLFSEGILQTPPKPELLIQEHSRENSHDSSNFLVPPSEKRVESDKSFNSTEHEHLLFLNPPKKSTELQPEEPSKASIFPKPLTSPSLSWLFSDYPEQSTTFKSTEPALHQFVTETREIAAIVNNELHPVSPKPFPVTSSTSQNTDISKSKKIQIIIPYTTKTKDGYDNNVLESVQHEVYETAKPPLNLNNSSLTSNRIRQHSEANQGVNVVINSGKNSHVSFKNEKNNRESDLSEMHHIIATNIRELLREEIEKSQKEQNYPLQNNIDNWTALEYSNHKTIEGAKAPKEIINQALSVTSIPGTSISHLLLPSKKIPNEYLVTTSLPIYDEPNQLLYTPPNVSVNSRPFTAKPYATTNLYYPTTNLARNHKKEQTPLPESNSERNYTEVNRVKVNNWARLNENLMLPAVRGHTKKTEDVTVSSWSTEFSSSSFDDEKVQIVTPVSSFSRKTNQTIYKRTTRHVQTTEKPTTVGKKIKLKQLSALLSRMNSTKLEKVSNTTAVSNRKRGVTNSTVPINRKPVQTTTEASSGVPTTQKSSKDTETPSPSVDVGFVSNANRSEQLSINDVFPFRNKELPWQEKLNVSQQIVRNDRRRKRLLKHIKFQKPKPSVTDSSS